MDDFLHAVSSGLLLFERNGRYRHAYMRDGMHGIHRLLAAEERREILRMFDAARRRRLVAVSRAGSRMKVALTPRGAGFLDRAVMMKTPSRKDGKRVHILYDIPERHRAQRDRLRTLLKRAGFRRRQQSVWWTGKDVALILKAWVRRNGLENWVDIIEN